jgi:hypothetical protein
MRVPAGTIHGLVGKVARFFRSGGQAKRSHCRNCKQGYGRPYIFDPSARTSTVEFDLHDAAPKGFLPMIIENTDRSSLVQPGSERCGGMA